MNRVYVLLLNWNGWADTLECLESVFRLDYPEFRVIVCDNDSTDGSLEMIKSWASGNAVSVPCQNPGLRKLTKPPVAKPIAWTELERDEAESGSDRISDPRLILIRTGGNLGFAGGNNVGLRYALARGDCGFVWLLNNDTVVAPDALRQLVATVTLDSVIGICGSTLLYYNDPDRIQARGGGYYCTWIGLPWLFGRWRRAPAIWPSPTRPSRWMNYVVGASMLVSREFLEEIGLMNEEYFLFFEETDWAWRGRRRFALGWAPGSRVYHKVGRSIGTSTNPRGKSLTCDYYALRNRLTFTLRYCPAALPTICLSLLGAALIRCCIGKWRNAAMILAIMFGRGASWEGRLQGDSSSS